MPEAKARPYVERRALRDKMRSLGFGYREIAVEFARSHKLRPRSAWREALGWTLKEAAERINAYAGRTGLDPDGACPMSGSHLADAESWPGEGSRLTGRRPRPYLFALLAAVYGCTVLDLIDLADREHLPPGELLILEKYSQNPPVAVSHPPAPSAHLLAQPSHALALPAADDDQRAVLELLGNAACLAPIRAAAAAWSSPAVPYRGMQEPDSWGSWIEREVLMTAHEGSEHAEQAEQRDIGDATLEQLHADVVRLSRQYMTSEPFTVLAEMRRVRSRIYSALDRRLWPRDQTDLYFLLACLNCLMAIAVKALGYAEAAEELVRAGWAYATAIDHRPLMSRLRMESADIAYLYNRPRQARDLAQSALRYQPDGPNAALVHLVHGQAAARLGDADAARSSITAAREAREREHTDDLMEMGGEFSFSLASQYFYGGAIVVQIPGGEADAINELQRATERYAAGPEPGEDHSGQCRILAHADLCTAQLRAGHLDAALAAIEPVMTLPPGLRTEFVSKRLTAMRRDLASRRYQGSPQARELDEQMEEFGRDTIVGALHNLPAGPG
jgi:tetratricopeptide (TPR) repeat protein